MREYEVTVNGLPHTMRLSEEDAKRYGVAGQAEKKSAEKPANKGRKPANKSE